MAAPNAPSPGQQVLTSTTLATTDQVEVQTTTGAVVASTTLSVLGAFLNAQQTVQPYLVHTGGVPAITSASGTNTTPSVTETYLCMVTVPAATTITGISIFNGDANAGNATVYLTNFAGTLLGSSASTALTGTDAYQRIPLSTAYAPTGSFSGFVLVQFNNTSARFNTHVFGDFPAGKLTSSTYGTFPTGFTVPTTFTASLGPMASLY